MFRAHTSQSDIEDEQNEHFVATTIYFETPKQSAWVITVPHYRYIEARSAYKLLANYCALRQATAFHQDLTNFLTLNLHHSDRARNDNQSTPSFCNASHSYRCPQAIWPCNSRSNPLTSHERLQSSQPWTGASWESFRTDHGDLHHHSRQYWGLLKGWILY